MKLAETIIDNEKNQRAAENKQLIRQRLKEVVYAFPQQTLQVLHKTGVPVGAILPPPVLYAVVVKHLATNSGLREAIAKMILEADGYASADGAVWQMVGGALSAVGSVLGGIGRGQSQTQADVDQQKQIEELQTKLANEQAQKSRQKWIWIGVIGIVVIAAIVGVRAFLKAKPTAPKPLATGKTLIPMKAV